jgi:hypothetical protein
MGKGSGLGDRVWISGVPVSGDVQTVALSMPTALLDVTGIDKSAHERIPGLRDGKMALATYWNSAVGGIHTVLKTLPRTDVIGTYFRGYGLGSPAASLVAVQPNYDPTRGTDGSLIFKAELDGDKYGLDWGVQLTNGPRTDTVATNGTSVDLLAPQSFGFQAFLHVSAFTGTDVTVKLQDSADNSTFADVASGGFTQITAITAQAQRIAVGGTATLRRYVRAVTVTTGGFTSVTFAVTVTQNLGALLF